MKKEETQIQSVMVVKPVKKELTEEQKARADRIRDVMYNPTNEQLLMTSILPFADIRQIAAKIAFSPANVHDPLRTPGSLMEDYTYVYLRLTRSIKGGKGFDAVKQHISDELAIALEDTDSNPFGKEM